MSGIDDYTEDSEFDLFKNPNEVMKGDFFFKINREDKTATLIEQRCNNAVVLIPRSIEHEGEEYIVTKIQEKTFYNTYMIKSIQFPLDSQIQTIEQKVFYKSRIESIIIPPSLFELQEGWCNNTPNLTKITVMPNNEHFMCLEEKMIVGKSDEKSCIYDVLVFVSRDAKKVKIPTFIKRIASFAFSLSLIESVKIPPHVTHIGEGAFYSCEHLNYVDIPPNSELQVIGKEAFANTFINSVFIPPHLTKICESAFYSCIKLNSIEIPKDSELQIIEEAAFNESAIASIYIPSNVVRICKNAFSNCSDLTEIEFAEDAKLDSFEELVFAYTPIKSITILPSVSELKNGWCAGTYNLNECKIMPNNPYFVYYENKMIIGKNFKSDYLYFVNRNLKEFIFPPFIKKIGAYAFSESQIEKIFIPPQIIKINYGAFTNCRRLKTVEIPSNSNLKKICKLAFFSSAIECFYIPPSVTYFNEEALFMCPKLKIVEIDENSELNHKICSLKFNYFTDVFLMVPAKLSDSLVNLTPDFKYNYFDF